jgi:glycosyltransferase involved in cell wall biosynthesis
MIYPFVHQIKKNSEIIPHSDYFFFFGRAGRTKGLIILINAINMLAKQGIKPQFILVISNHPKVERSNITRFISKNNLKNIIVLDQMNRDQLIAYIIHARAVIVPSLTEGFGYAALEANQLGIPVIYSDNTSLEEVVSYGKPFRNGSPASLSNVIKTSIIDNNWQLKKLRWNNTKQLELWKNLF